MDLFLCLTPALNVGHRLDNVLKLRKLNFGSANLILASLLISFGLFWVAWSWHSLLTVGKGLPHEAFGVALAPSTSGSVTTGPFRYTSNPIVFGYLIGLVGVAWARRSVGALLIRPDGLLSQGFRAEEPGQRFGDERIWHRQFVRYEAI
jgi:protein-S-isoprenylcysteine O-methyltransferase Ste14